MASGYLAIAKVSKKLEVVESDVMDMRRYFQRMPVSQPWQLLPRPTACAGLGIGFRVYSDTLPGREPLGGAECAPRIIVSGEGSGLRIVAAHRCGLSCTKAINMRERYPGTQTKRCCEEATEAKCVACCRGLRFQCFSPPAPEARIIFRHVGTSVPWQHFPVPANFHVPAGIHQLFFFL